MPGSASDAGGAASQADDPPPPAQPPGGSWRPAGLAPGFARLWVAAVMMPLAGLAAAGWWSWSNVIESAHGEMARTVGMVHAQVLRTLDAQETVLAGMEAFVADMTWAQMRASRSAHEFARRVEAMSDTVQTLGVIDPNGRLAVASESPDPPADISLADRDFVRAFPAGTPARRTFVSAVVISRIDRRIHVHASRPRIGPDGQADGGVIASAFLPAQFESFFAEVAETRNTGFTILRGDGAILANFPRAVSREAEALPPDDPAQPHRWAGTPDAADDLVLQHRGSLLGGLQLIAARPLHKFGVFIVHRLDPSVLAKRWARQMVPPAAAACVAMALLLVLTARAQARTAHAAAALRQRTEAAEAGQVRALERAELEAQLRQAEKVAALGQLVAGVAHDFNNLLQTIVLNAEMLEQTPGLSPTAQRGAELIVHASERGMALTRRMLEFARHDDPRPGEVSQTEVAPALRGAQDLLGGTLGGLYPVRIDMEDGLPKVQCEAGALELVLVNLMLNARDAMPRGGDVVVRATRQRVDDGAHGSLAAGVYVRIDISDRGSGMDPATLARAGEAFFTTKASGRGTGLGLSMARGFARGVGGALDLDSTAGEGTTVTLWLPEVA